MTRALEDFPLGNVPLREHHRRLFDKLGVAGPDVGIIEVNPHAWLDEAEVAMFLQDRSARALQTKDGLALLLRAGGTREVTAQASFAIRYAWDLLEANAAALRAATDYRREGDIHPSLYVDGRLQVGKGSRILPGVVVEGDVVIGEGCKVGPNCYLRGATSVGDRCHVGQAVELKNAILLDGAQVGHLSYVGDSILGEKTNFGAGTITSNLRHDGGNHRSPVGDVMVDTGRRKLGAIIGDHVHTGIHTAIYPGRKIWPRASTRPGAVVDRDIVA